MGYPPCRRPQARPRSGVRRVPHRLPRAPYRAVPLGAQVTQRRRRWRGNHRLGASAWGPMAAPSPRPQAPLTVQRVSGLRVGLAALTGMVGSSSLGIKALGRRRRPRLQARPQTWRWASSAPCGPAWTSMRQAACACPCRWPPTHRHAGRTQLLTALTAAAAGKDLRLSGALGEIPKLGRCHQCRLSKRGAATNRSGQTTAARGAWRPTTPPWSTCSLAPLPAALPPPASRRLRAWVRLLLQQRLAAGGRPWHAHPRAAAACW